MTAPAKTNIMSSGMSGHCSRCEGRAGKGLLASAADVADEAALVGVVSSDNTTTRLLD